MGAAAEALGTPRNVDLIPSGECRGLWRGRGCHGGGGTLARLCWGQGGDCAVPPSCADGAESLPRNTKPSGGRQRPFRFQMRFIT